MSDIDLLLPVFG